jgi:uncharacterized membrane protein
MSIEKTIPEQNADSINSAPGVSKRINSIDLLRGLVMIIMALDHTRDFFHSQAFTDDPLNLSTTTPLLFFTRWVTHFCAPVFVFLAGTSVYLQGLRKNKKELSIFLIKRGIWLIFIELFIFSLALTFDVTFSAFILQVIWAIGISMILLSLVIWLPFTAIFIVGLIIVSGHNLLDYAEANHNGSFGFWWSLLHRVNPNYPLWGNHTLMIFYPFLPWTGLMILGYCFGKLFTDETIIKKRKKIITAIGLGLILLFIALRFTNVYGDPGDWSVQKTNLLTFFSFISTNKYPPSLLFMCMTMGPALIFLAWCGNAGNRLSKIITVYGRVPLLYFILHFYILHTLCMVLFLVRGHSFAEGVNNNFLFKFIIPGEGYDLWVVYIIWILVVIALYPICRWFSNYKLRHRRWWLSYL